MTNVTPTVTLDAKKLADRSEGLVLPLPPFYIISEAFFGQMGGPKAGFSAAKRASALDNLRKANIARVEKHGQFSDPAPPEDSESAAVGILSDALSLEKARKQRAQMDKRNLTKQNGRMQDRVDGLELESALQEEAVLELEARLALESLSLGQAEDQISTLEVKQAQLIQTSERYRKRGMRARLSKEKAIEHAVQDARTIHLKEDGVIPDCIREYVRNLAALGVSTHAIPKSLNFLHVSLGFNIDGSISKRSVERIIAEGGIASHLQLCEAITKASCEYPVAYLLH